MIIYLRKALMATFTTSKKVDKNGFVSATAAKRSRGDVFRRESVLSCDRLSKFLKFNYSHIFTRMNLIS